MTPAAKLVPVVVLAVAGSALATPAAAPVTAEHFVERCKTDARFCRIQIMAVEDGLEKSRKACLPASLTKDAMAARVRDTLDNVVDEVPEFKTGPYRQFIEQIITFLWPCEPIS